MKQFKSTKWEIGWQRPFKVKTWCEPSKLHGWGPHVTSQSFSLFSIALEHFRNLATHEDPLALLQGWTLILQIFPFILSIKHSRPAPGTTEDLIAYKGYRLDA